MFASKVDDSMSPIPYIYGVHPYHSVPLLDEIAIIKVAGQEIQTMPDWGKQVNEIQFRQKELVGQLEIYNPALNAGIRYLYDSSFMQQAWLWFHYEPELGHHVTALIPCTTSGDQGIQGAKENGRIRYLKPNEIAEARWSLEII